ncbi:hypothetical protein HNP86_001882 [Methanococcus maripaludis]|uniref:Uncharacterized protein n=1 Tax=Methanococcus maripaludis TaxID=39152 RepID=A0A7J9NXI3_METMI|nr:hypothetical protein [Methanococcus maripaludis]MBA2851723.1 hypothetical protein [Methanococcus maripaludis]
MKKDSVRETAHQVIKFNVGSVRQLFKSKSRGTSTVMDTVNVLPETTRCLSATTSSIVCNLVLQVKDVATAGATVYGVISSGINFVLPKSKFKRASSNDDVSAVVVMKPTNNPITVKYKTDVPVTNQTPFYYRFFVKQNEFEYPEFNVPSNTISKIKVSNVREFSCSKSYVPVKSQLHFMVNPTVDLVDINIDTSKFITDTAFVNELTCETRLIESVSKRLYEKINVDVYPAQVSDARAKTYEITDMAMNAITLISSVNTLITVKFPKEIISISPNIIEFSGSTLQCKLSQPGLHEITVVFDDGTTFDLKLYINMYTI